MPPSPSFDALETLEDALLVGGIDARALVGDVTRAHTRRTGRSSDVTVAAVGRMTDGIADQVDQDLDDTARICPGAASGRLGCRLDRDAALLGRRFEHARPPRSASADQIDRSCDPASASSLIERMTDSRWRAAAAMSLP